MWFGGLSFWVLKILKIIGGIPLTSNEAKELVDCEISEENELLRPLGLVYYEDIHAPLFGIPGRAIVCFNHADLERERSTRLKKIAVAEKEIDNLLNSKACNKSSDCLEKVIKAIIRGVSSYFILQNKIHLVTLLSPVKFRVCLTSDQAFQIQILILAQREKRM